MWKAVLAQVSSSLSTSCSVQNVMHLCCMGLSKVKEKLNLGLAGDVFCGFTSSRPGHGYWSICGKELPSTACLSPFLILRAVSNASLQCGSTFSIFSWSKLFRSGFFFFFFWCHFFPPCRVLHLSLEGNKENEPTDKIPFLSCVCCFFVAGHHNNILTFVWDLTVLELLLYVSVSDPLAAGRSWTVSGYRPWREQGWTGEDH